MRIFPGKTVIGSCSICGGSVTIHEMWGATIPDIPRCEDCGAVKADPPGPTIPMRPTQGPGLWIAPKITVNGVPAQEG